MALAVQVGVHHLSDELLARIFAGIHHAGLWPHSALSALALRSHSSRPGVLTSVGVSFWARMRLSVGLGLVIE